MTKIIRLLPNSDEYIALSENLCFIGKTTEYIISAALYELCAAPSPWPQAIPPAPLRQRRYP